MLLEKLQLVVLRKTFVKQYEVVCSNLARLLFTIDTVSQFAGS